MYMLQIKRLDQGTALELVKASRALSWSSLYPILNAMAELTCFGPRDDHELSVLHMLNAFEALDLLLGEVLLLCCRVVSTFWMNACLNLRILQSHGPPVLPVSFSANAQTC